MVVLGGDETKQNLVTDIGTEVCAWEKSRDGLALNLELIEKKMVCDKV